MTARIARPAAIVTDIEGTTTPIAFVKDVLFPYARTRLPAFVNQHGRTPEIAAVLDATAKAAGIAADDRHALVAVLTSWSDEDRKIGPLKTLQGLIWAEGYRTGQIRAPVFADAATVLQQWHAQQITLAVYSSGSVLAQKLLFAATDHGDLAQIFTSFFDTSIGGKREPASYGRIAGTLRIAPGDIVFLSDIAEELDAAETAGVRTLHVVRPGEGTTPTQRHPHVATFDAISWI